MKYDVFISYRREGGDTLAQLIYDRLTHRGYQVFLDIESLSGGKFNEKLLSVIEECKDIVVILPPNALDRCHNEGDWLYRELEHGIKLSKNIIPVMMKNFVWPENIPEEIAEIQNFNGILDNKDYFDAVIDKLTTLLKSKPRIGGDFLRKFHNTKLLFQTGVKRRRKVLISLLLFLLVGAGIFSTIYWMNAKKQKRAESYVEIELTAPEEMSASEYYDAIEILKDRFEILADGYDYDFESTEDKIKVSIPNEVFHDIPVDVVLKCYVSRPCEIYLGPESGVENSTENILVEREHIKGMELSKEHITLDESFDYEIQGVENQEDCRSFALQFEEDVFENLSKSFDIERLIQDAEKNYNSTYFYYITAVDEENNKIYFMDNYQYDNILNLIEYNYTHDTFSEAFYYSIKLPVEWESIEELDGKQGKNQCNIAELPEDVMRIDFTTYTSEITEGEFLDTVKILKLRLDSLETPYAFGYRTDNPYYISIKINPERINDQILSAIITSYDNFSIKTNFYELVSQYYVEKAEIIQNDEGCYLLQITPTSSWYNSVTENEWKEVITDSDNISLSFGSSPAIPFSTVSYAEGFDGSSFVFDNLNAFDIEKIDEEHKYILDLIRVVISEDKLPYTYSVDSIFVDELADPEEINYLEEIVSKEVKQNIEKIVAENSFVEDYEVSVTNIGQEVQIKLSIPEDASFTSNVNTTLQDLCQQLDVESGDIGDINVFFRLDSLEGAYIQCHMSTNLTEHKMYISGYYSDGFPNNHKEKFESILKEDTFYMQFMVYDWSLDENGKLSFDKL